MPTPGLPTGSGTAKKLRFVYHGTRTNKPKSPNTPQSPKSLKTNIQASLNKFKNITSRRGLHYKVIPASSKRGGGRTKNHSKNPSIWRQRLNKKYKKHFNEYTLKIRKPYILAPIIEENNNNNNSNNNNNNNTYYSNYSNNGSNSNTSRTTRLTRKKRSPPPMPPTHPTLTHSGK